MNCTKLLNELKMKNGRNVKLNKHYLLAVFFILVIQTVMGIGYASAICDSEKRIYCAEELKYRVGSSDWENCKNQNDVRVNELIELFKHNRKFYSSDEEYINYQIVHELKVQNYKGTNSEHVYRRARNDFELCVLKHALGKSSSDSSNQSNEKANRQSANNQSSSSGSQQPNVENYSEMDDKSLLSAYNLAVDNNQPDKEFKALLELAKRGNAAGQYNLGVRYANGDGTKQDFAKAMYWYEQAAKKQHSGAMFNLGNMYYKGQGVSADNKKAFYWWQEGAFENDLDAITQIGEAYFYGIGVSKNEYSANSYTEKAAKRGHPRAIENLKKFDY